jgi:AraC-like DNA-binding protein
MSLNTPTVSAVAVLDLADELRVRELIDETELAQLGSEFNEIYQRWQQGEAIQEARLPESLLVYLWQKAQQAEDDGRVQNLGLSFGSQLNEQALGVLANWLFQCQTLGEAFATFSKHIVLMNPAESWQARPLSNSQADFKEQKTTEGRIRKERVSKERLSKEKVKEDTAIDDLEQASDMALELTFNHSGYPVIAIQRSMAAILCWSRALSKLNISPVTVCFTFDAPKDLTPYLEFFDAQLKFNQPTNSLVFQRQVLELAIEQSNPYLKALIAKQALALAESLTTADTVRDKVVKLLSQNLAKFSQISQACNALHLSRSTLYRKLKQHDTSFTELVQDIRLETLRSGQLDALTHEEQAEYLGFNDVGSFYRFKRTKA